ncbi:MAG: multidrug transporter, partial [Oscillospiraceae bacterium]|nr:multidrug transporter [Oscillospiraceae bacterium]
MNISEKDWKLFRKKVPQWQEAYMDRLAREYIAILSGSENSSEKFWNLYDRINADVNCVGVQIRMSRSRMIQNIISLINEGAITLDDLSD